MMMKSLRIISVLFLAFPLWVGAEEKEDQGLSFKKMSLAELMDQDVTSVSKRSEHLGEAPAAIQVITSEQIRRSGAASIPEALRLADNLEVAQKGAHGWSISARGFNTDLSNKLLVLVDGRTVYTPLFSGVFWDLQDYPLADIDRIEVISGPGGTLWGANAVNGVINIITKDSRETQGFRAEGAAGSELRGSGSVRGGGSLGPDIFLRVYGKYDSRDGAVLSSGADAPDAWRMARAGFRMDGGDKGSDSFTLQGESYGGNEGISTGGDSDVNGQNILARWSHVFTEGSDMRLQAYFDRTYLGLPVPAGFTDTGVLLAPPGELRDIMQTFDLDFQHHFRIGEAQNIVWGLGYRRLHDEVGNAPGLAFLPETWDQSLYSLFLQDEVAVAPKWAFTLGSKVEHNDYTGYEFEPGARLKWDAAEDRMFWAAVSRAVRAPSRVDRDNYLPTPAQLPTLLGIRYILAGNSSFKSETLVAYELGCRAGFGDLASVSLSLFYNVYDDIRSTGQSPKDVFGFTFPFFYENNLQGDTYGAELSADLQVMEGWRLHGGYSYLKECLHVRPGQADFNQALNETADPENRASLRSSVDLPEGFELDPALRWVDAFIYNNSGVPATVPSYLELDLRLGWHPAREIEVSVSGQSLLHDHHLEYVVSHPNPEEGIQRGFYGKVACQW